MGANNEARLSKLQALTGVATQQAPIGSSLERIRTRLLLITIQLEQHLADHALPLLQEARAQLELHACRIAVVGQVKSGKTTLINALVQSPNLLPTDINPWTAVVTSLHFRNAAQPPEHAAAFRFFSLEEWRDLAEGGGKLRELTGRLVPEFRTELLRAQLEAMYQRAGHRLGSSMEQLLGQCHQYKHITPELLSDYISAGDDAAEGFGPDARRIYSDITRSAELFFNKGPFDFPVTLIDTPGTNDPFLVRDEVTRRSLENPDVYVFVMSALQPLLPADTAMLRMLNGLHKDRIVVFVNRIDQLQNPASDGAKVKAVVEKRLRLEFPTLNIPVIVGSAWLGRFCDSEQLSKLPPHFTSEIVAALRYAGVKGADDEAHLNAFERSHLASILQAVSGMRTMAATLTKVLSVSNSSVLLQRIANSYFELARYAEIASRAELQSAEAPSNGKHEATQESQFLKRAELLRDSFRQIEANLEDLVSAKTVLLADKLRKAVETFADDEAAAVQREMNRTQKVWVCDVARLREELELAYVSSFEEAMTSLKGIEQGLYPHLDAVVSSLLPGHQGAPIEAPAENMQIYPSTAPLSDFVTMDLAQSWWKMWFAARPNAQERADQLRNLIEDDFRAPVDKLVGEAETQLRQRVDYTMKKMQAVSNSLLAIAERHANSASNERLDSDRGDAKLREKATSERQQRHIVCAQRLTNFVAIGDELRDLLKRLDLMWAENSGAN